MSTRFDTSYKEKRVLLGWVRDNRADIEEARLVLPPAIYRRAISIGNEGIHKLHQLLKHLGTLGLGSAVVSEIRATTSDGQNVTLPNWRAALLPQPEQDAAANSCIAMYEKLCKGSGEIAVEAGKSIDNSDKIYTDPISDPTNHIANIVEWGMPAFYPNQGDRLPATIENAAILMLEDQAGHKIGPDTIIKIYLTSENDQPLSADLFPSFPEPSPWE